MTFVSTFITGITTILIDSLTWIGTNDSVLIAPFIFWLITNVVLLFRIILLASYRKGFY